MPDIRELKDQATKLFSKGKYEKAASVYGELCRLEPKDMQMRVRLGDACVKGGDKPGAIEAYRVAAESYAREGFLPRAIAVCKLILEIEPAHVSTQQTLAQLYAKKSGRPVGDAQPAAAAAARPVAPARSAARSAAPAAPATKAAPATPVVSVSAAETIELDTGPRDFTVGVASASGEAREPVEPSWLDLDTGDQQADWKGAPAWSAPSSSPVPQPAEAAVAPPPPPAPPRNVAAPLQPPPAPASVAAAPVQPRSAPPAAQAPARPPAAPAAVPPAAPAEVAGVSIELELSPEEMALPGVPAHVELESPASGPEQPPAASPAVPAAPAPSAPQSGEDVMFAAEEAGAPAFSLGDLDLGEPELVDTDAPAVSAAPATPAPAAAAALDEQGGDAWWAPPENDPPQSLADLCISSVDEEKEVELLTVSTDVPLDAASLPEIPLFSDLSREAFIDLASRCTLLRPAAGEVVVEEGSIGTSFYVVSGGSVRVVKQRPEGGGEVVLARLGEGSFFGEMALISGARRTASVVAEEDTDVLEISAALLADLQRRYPHVGQVLKKFCRQRLLANVMATSPLFKPFGKQERNALVEKFKARDVEQGEVVLREGKLSDGLFVLMTGELEVSKQKGDEVLRLARLKEGDVFGEISLLTKSAATATVAAVRHSTLLRLPRETFDEVISTHPQILMLVSELSDERLQYQQALESGLLAEGEDGLMLL